MHYDQFGEPYVQFLIALNGLLADAQIEVVEL
jgi:hypothetical protein